LPKRLPRLRRKAFPRSLLEQSASWVAIVNSTNLGGA
jgi:hypothetical protein